MCTVYFFRKSTKIYIVLKFIDIETEKTVGKNQIGELRVKGKALMSGYFNNPETKDAFDENGFLITGDIGYYDEDYCLYIVDRIKDLIKYQSWHVRRDSFIYL